MNYKVHFTSPHGDDTAFDFGVFFDDGDCGPANILTPPADHPGKTYFANDLSPFLDITVDEFTISTGTTCPISYTTWITKDGAVIGLREFMGSVERGLRLSPTTDADDLGSYYMHVTAQAGCQSVKSTPILIMVIDCTQDELDIDPGHTVIKPGTDITATYVRGEERLEVDLTDVYFNSLIFGTKKNDVCGHYAVTLKNVDGTDINSEIFTFDWNSSA